MRTFSLLMMMVIPAFYNAQCPVITCPTTLNLTTCIGQTVTATSNYSANISSKWIAPNGVQLASVGTATSTVLLGFAGTYTVQFRDNSSNCVTNHQITVTSTTDTPFALAGVNQLCGLNTVTLSITNAQSMPVGGAVLFAIAPMPNPTVIPSLTFTQSPTYTMNCNANYIMAVANVQNSCMGFYPLALNCPTQVPIPVNISGVDSVCQGSSTSLITNNVSSILWNTGAVTASINVSPTVNTAYNVTGFDINGCYTSGSVTVKVNTMCAVVWPGDADADGTVNNVDVLELGLAAGSTGPARSFTSTAFSGQFASTWTGTVSTGKNRCHADCNGDGFVNSADAAAITANFSFTHAFRPGASSVDPQLKLDFPYQSVVRGGWNTFKVLMDNTTLPPVYGVAFDVSYNQLLADSVKITYPASFLNAANTNIDFAYPVQTSGMIYGATVRTDHLNVSGVGIIAEVSFKVKENAPSNGTFPVGIKKAVGVKASGERMVLTTGSISAGMDNAVGLEDRRGGNVNMYPNPARDFLNLQNSDGVPAGYEIYNVSGVKLLTGQLEAGVQVNISNLEAGYYTVLVKGQETRAFRLLISDNSR
jgi:hypothetical protein